jgi:hypothetical protein
MADKRDLRDRILALDEQILRAVLLQLASDHPLLVGETVDRYEQPKGSDNGWD